MERGERLKLEEKGASYVHILVGAAVVQAGGITYATGARSSVWVPPVIGLLVTGGELIAASEGLDVLVAHEPGAAAHAAEFVQAEEHLIGAGTAQRRVWEVVGAKHQELKLRCGETLNVKGGWSSWPEHSFDRDPSASEQFEEVFLYFCDPRSGWALQKRKGVMPDGTDINDCSQIYSGSFLEMPLGRHPVVAGPDTTLLYVWFYVAPVSKLYGRWAEDVGTYL